MKNLKLSVRLGLAFGLVVLLLSIVSVLGISRMAHIQDQLQVIVDENNVMTSEAVAMRIAINQVSAATRNLVLVTDDAENKYELDVIERARTNYNNARDHLAKLFADDPTTSAEEKTLLATIIELEAKVRPLNNKAVELAKANHNEEAAAILMNEARRPQQQWLDALGKLAELEASLNVEAADAAERDYETARNVMIVVSVLAALAATVAAVWLTVSLTRQLGGEPGYAAEVVQRVANGDLSEQVKVNAGDTTSLLAAMGGMQAALVKVVGNIRQGADNIATGSTQIATGNADLSQRTEEQASNLQQTAASMEQLTATVKNNSDTARQASELAKAASDVAAQGGVAVSQVVSTMGDISAASQRIADIISVIDGIAFQTNILALNAAVEAARAGEQGRGFAVVASEVRALASRSADAAKEIKHLIANSTEKVEAGSSQVAEAGSTIQQAVAQVRRVSDLLNEISAATHEQTQGIGQINDAVTQLDQVTQQNAALVEESAAAADSLRVQASQLVESVAIFRTSALARAA